MPARSNIPPEAFEEIYSGRLGFREVRRIYGIGHARYRKIQQRVETSPSVVPPHPPPPPHHRLSEKGAGHQWRGSRGTA